MPTIDYKKIIVNFEILKVQGTHHKLKLLVFEIIKQKIMIFN